LIISRDKQLNKVSNINNGIMDKTSANKSPLVFFVLVYTLSIPLWIVGATVKVRGLPLDVPVTDFNELQMLQVTTPATA